MPANKDKVFNVSFSYLEIYNETVVDLLCNNNFKKSLMVAEDNEKGVYIPDLTEYEIESAD